MTTVDFDLTDEQMRATGLLKWNVQPANVLPAWVAEMDCRPCPAVHESIRMAVARGTFGYPLFDSLSDLPAATVEFQAKQFGWQVDPSMVIGCADVMAGVGLALEYLCEDAPVVVPTPAYPPFLNIVPLLGLEMKTVDCVINDGRYELDLDGIDAALAAGARTVLLCQPHNPLGRAFTVEELTALRDVVKRHGARVVSDEIHAPLVLPGATHIPYASIPDTADHVTTIVAASKAFNIPGLKCAQLIAGNEADRDKLRSLHYVANHGITPIGIQATVAAYRWGGPWLESLIEHLDQQRALTGQLVAELLPHVSYIAPEATYLSWLDVRASEIEDPSLAAREGGVELSVGKDFGTDFVGFARLNFATSAERLERVIGRLALAWGSA
jgi:cystathionine beta-lyase